MVHIFKHIFKVGLYLLGIRYVRGRSATVPDSLYANMLSSIFDILRDNQVRKRPYILECCSIKCDEIYQWLKIYNESEW